MALIFFLVLIFFIIGLFFGSFFNVIIDRIVRGEQFWKGRSYCESCKHELSTRDLIPVFSFLLQKGKCRYCKVSIPWMLTVVEVTTGVIFWALAYWYFYLSTFSLTGTTATMEGILFLGFVLAVASTLIVIFFADLKYKLIPDVFVIALAGMYAIFALLFYVFNLAFTGYGELLFSPTLSHVLAALIMVVFFGGLFLITKGKAMGEGDIYLAAVLALYLGVVLSLVMWFFAFILGALAGVAIIITTKKTIKYAVPFGPFLIVGFGLAVLIGTVVVEWYTSSLGLTLIGR